MATTHPSFVKALIAYFGSDRKLEIAEMKALTNDDKVELSTLLNKEDGYDHPAYAG